MGEKNWSTDKIAQKYKPRHLSKTDIWTKLACLVEKG